MENSPELDLINQFEYDLQEILGIKVYFSCEKSNLKFSLKEIENILQLIPPEHRSFIPRIYLVTYFDKNSETKGRHLASLSYVIVYPNAFTELEEVLIHEIGHVLWDRKLSPSERVQFYETLLQEVPATLRIEDELKRHVFVLENFANCYMFFLCKIFDSQKYPLIYKFILSLF